MSQYKVRRSLEHYTTGASLSAQMASKHLVTALGLCAALFPVLGLAGVPANIVDLGYVKYAGNLSYPDTVAYLGISYADPPLAERRFRAPLPLDTAGDTHAGVVDQP
ncbi:hypothetical protein C2E23DRAFT_842918 [Lenzites betulinus]|nr:hypothetical protein C2E23DRAFT_842918 [Lenzites betulinus]